MIDLNPIPNRLLRPDTLDDDADGFFNKLPQFGLDLITLQANLSTLAAGGAYAFAYKFTASGNLGSGQSVFAVDDVSNQLATPYLYLDKVSFGANLFANLQEWDDSSSAIKGKIRIQKLGDASRQLTFNLVGNIITATNHVAFPVSGASALGVANPFAVNDTVLIFFQRTGDKGDTVSGQPTLHLREERASGTASTIPTTLSAGVFRRPLNVAKVNTISGASLASDQFVLPVGTYDLDAESFSAIYTGSGGARYYHKMALYNVTDGAYVVIGQTGLSWDPNNLGSTSYAQMAPPSMRGTFTVSGASKTFELRHLSPNANMFAAPAASAGQVEVYTDLIIRKTA